MISAITIILFFVYTYGIGFTFTSFLKQSENFFEKHIMRIGIGLGILPIILTLLNTLRIPIDWKIVLAISLVYPVIFIIKNAKSIKPRINLKNLNVNILILVLIFGFTLYTYEKGAFAYPWLEDDDPWAHANGVKYVSLEKTAFEPTPGQNNLIYLDPYPPGYDLLMGVLHQTSPSIKWTLKFFNALIISLSIVFFYYFASNFMKSNNKALFATFVLAMVPAYMSHFIWAISLVIPVFFIAMYCLEQSKEDKKWGWVGALAIASILVIQPTTGAKLIGMIFIYYIVNSFFQKKYWNSIAIALILGILISGLFWWGPIVIKYKSDFMLNFGWDKGLDTPTQPSEEGGVKKGYIGFLGSATRKYTFDDYFTAKPQNMINNPIGIGIALSLLIFVSVIYIVIFLNKGLLDKKNGWIAISFIWMIFTFIGVNGGTRWWSPIAFWSFRFWMLLAISISLVSAAGMWFLFALFKKFGIPKLIVLALLCIGIIFTSGYQKYSVNTAMWGPGGLLSEAPGLLEGYLWLETLPPETKIYPMSAAEMFIIGLDRFSCGWCKDQIMFRNESYDYSDMQMYNWLKEKGYEYLIIDRFYADDYGVNKTSERLEMLENSEKFNLVYSTQSAFIFKVA